MASQAYAPPRDFRLYSRAHTSAACDNNRGVVTSADGFITVTAFNAIWALTTRDTRAYVPLECGFKKVATTRMPLFAMVAAMCIFNHHC